MKATTFRGARRSERRAYRRGARRHPGTVLITVGAAQRSWYRPDGMWETLRFWKRFAVMAYLPTRVA